MSRATPDPAQWAAAGAAVGGLALVVAAGLAALDTRAGPQPQVATQVVASAAPPPAPEPAPQPLSSSAEPTPSATSSVTPSATSSVTPSASPTRAATPPRPATPPASATATSFTATGRLVAVPGRGPVLGRGPLRRFVVEVEAGSQEDPAAFAGAVERVLGDRRSWSSGGRASFQRVPAGPVDFRVVLATPRTTDRLCAPLRTGGIYSCYAEGRAVLNLMRWRNGALAYAGDLPAYRAYMVNHEVGHGLGHGHADCTGAGRRAPVMMQQTKGVGGCRPNPWPFPSG